MPDERKRGIKDERIKFSTRQQKDRERASRVCALCYFFSRDIYTVSVLPILSRIIVFLKAPRSAMYYLHTFRGRYINNYSWIQYKPRTSVSSFLLFRANCTLKRTDLISITNLLINLGTLNYRELIIRIKISNVTSLKIYENVITICNAILYKVKYAKIFAWKKKKKILKTSRKWLRI